MSSFLLSAPLLGGLLTRITTTTINHAANAANAAANSADPATDDSGADHDAAIADPVDPDDVVEDDGVRGGTWG